jgi:hypothetical protein
MKGKWYRLVRKILNSVKNNKGKKAIPITGREGP